MVPLRPCFFNISGEQAGECLYGVLLFDITFCRFIQCLGTLAGPLHVELVLLGYKARIKINVGVSNSSVSFPLLSQ